MLLLMQLCIIYFFLLFFLLQIFMLSLQTLLHTIIYLLNEVTKGERLDTSMKCKDRNVMSKHQSVACINKG